MNTNPPTLFTLLDAARMGADMATAKEQFPERFVSLYKGESAKALADFAPYLFWFDTGTSTTDDWFMTNGWGKSWGVFLQSRASVSDVYRHFRQYLIIQDESGRELYFRFYDPRVLRAFLPTCNAGQLREFFGPVQHFFMEDEDPDFALFFRLNAGLLESSRVGRTEMEKQVFNRSFTPFNT